MHKARIFTGIALALGLSSAMFTTNVSAANITGKANLICASVKVVGCTDGNCIQGEAQSFEMPTFLFVDAKRKLVLAKDEKGKEVTSPIKSYEITENALILQGFENHRGWTLGVERGTGKMTLSSTGADVNFIVFGNCTER